MGKNAILICGMPASGKTTMARRLSERLGVSMFSKDEIKELLYDTIGFRSREEKVALGVGAMEAMYYAAGQVFAAGGSAILENNFEWASENGLRALLDKYGCTPVTIQLTGDYMTIYERFLLRDRSPERHRGHVVNTQYPELPGPRPEYEPISFRQFVEGFTSRGMADFHIGGPRLVVDVTDLSQVDYEQVTRDLLSILSRH